MARPAGVTIIAILFLVGTAAGVLFEGWLIAHGFFTALVLAARHQGGNAGRVSRLAETTLLLNSQFAVLVALYAVTGWGLLKLKSWARVLTITLLASGVVHALLAWILNFDFAVPSFLMIAGVLLLYAAIIGYLLKGEVKAAFA